MPEGEQNYMFTLAPKCNLLKCALLLPLNNADNVKKPMYYFNLFANLNVIINSKKISGVVYLYSILIRTFTIGNLFNL